MDVKPRPINSSSTAAADAASRRRQAGPAGVSAPISSYQILNTLHTHMFQPVCHYVASRLPTQLCTGATLQRPLTGDLLERQVI